MVSAILIVGTGACDVGIQGKGSGASDDPDGSTGGLWGFATGGSGQAGAGNSAGATTAQGATQIQVPTDSQNSNG